MNKRKPPTGKPFQKGQSGNPGGRQKLPYDLKVRCRDLTPEMVDVWAKVARDEAAPAKARVDAASAIVERAYGRAPQTLDVTVNSPLDDLSADQLLALAAALASRLGGAGDPGEDGPAGPEARALPPVH